MSRTNPPTATTSDAPIEGAWGPSVRGGRRGNRRRWIVLAVVALVVLPLLYGTALTLRANGSVTRMDVSGLSPHEGGPLNILVVGSDSREGLSEQEQVELGTGFVEGERTDSIFVLSIEGSRAGLLAFPRDLYVTRCDGSTGRINAAYSSGGPGCLVDTVQSLSGLPVHHFVAVSFGGFRDIVDAVGGVDICVDKRLLDPYAGVDLYAGCQTLDGRQALGYVRTRKLDSDLERIKRQQEFLGALAGKIATSSTVLNPPRAWSVTGAVGSALRADSGLGLFDLMRLANGLRGLAGGHAITATVPGTPATIGGAWVLRVDEGAANQLFASFRDGSILDQATGDVAPADVQVRVLNAAGVSGLASATRDALTARGYQVVGIGDADNLDETTIRFTAADRAKAELLARELPVDAKLEEVAAIDSVTLLLGADLSGGIG